mgnify:CR=1 FL=1
MTLFPHHTIQVKRETRSPECGYDSYGKPKKCLTTITTLKGDLQPANANEQMRDFGRVAQGRYKLYLPHTANITKTDKLVIDGETYQVEGIPDKRTIFPSTSHLKVYLQLEG